MRSNRTMMFAGVIGLLGTALAASAPMEPGTPEAEPGSTKYDPRRASGNTPVSGGGAKERAKRIARMEKAAAKAAASPEPCCMWCGKDKPAAGWHFLCYPRALCSKECEDGFKAAF